MNKDNARNKAIYINGSLHKRVKIYCVEKGITLAEYIECLISKDLSIEKENE